MDERHKKLLQRNDTALIITEPLTWCPKCGLLNQGPVTRVLCLPDLVQLAHPKRVAGGVQKAIFLNAARTKSKKDDMFLQPIRTRESCPFHCLCEVAKASVLCEVPDILKPDQKPHLMETDGPPQQNSSGDNNEDDDLPMKWPTKEAIQDAKEIRFVEPADTWMKQIFEKSLRPNQEAIYVMKRRQRGTVLIINNLKFKTLRDRAGTNEDANALKHLFREFGFNVEVIPDLTAQKMEKRLREEAEKKEHKDADCFILFILSHGHLGVVFGTDGKAPKVGSPENFVEVKTIQEIFCTSVSLQGKPKLLFIQACQGDKTDSGIEGGENESYVGKAQDTKNDSPQAQDVPMEESGAAANEPGNSGDAEAFGQVAPDTSEMSKKTTEFLEELNPTEQSDGPTATPTFAHCFLGMATTADYVSWRNKDLGTWFIQAIMYIFAKYAFKYHLNEMMIMVNRLVSKGRTDKGNVQVAQNTDTFHRKFYFFPGLHREQ